jgi:hypothetical protein
MKRAILTLAIATLALSTVSLAAPATNQKPAQAGDFYAVTNNDIATANTASKIHCHYKFPLTLICTFGVALETGGSGLGGGYFANNRLTAQTNGDCLFVSDAGSEDIAAFTGTYKNGKLTFNNMPTRTPTGGSGSAYGIGLAVTPQNDMLFATLDENEEIAIFTIGKGCTLTANGTVPESDFVGPMAITQDGKVLVVSGPNNSYIDAWTINHTAHTLTPLGTPLVLGGISSCASVGCFPTGLDTAKIVNGKTLVVAGNATLSGPYYITAQLDESSGLSNGNTFNITGTSLANIESPWYGSAAHDDNGTGFIYFAAAGFGSGYPAGVSVNQVTNAVINPVAISSLVNNNAYYASNAQSTGHQSNQKAEYVWQSGVDSNLDNTMYLYKVTPAGAISQALSVANPDAQGNTYVLSLIAFPGRHGSNK